MRSVGLVGALFGGTVAALMLEGLGLPGLALIEPATRGKRYIRETIRRQAIAELMASVDVSPNGDGAKVDHPTSDRGLLEELAAEGQTSVRGLRLCRRVRRISGIDLARDVGTFRGRSLLVGVSPSGSISPGLEKLRAHLEELGGAVALEALEDPLPAPSASTTSATPA